MTPDNAFEESELKRIVRARILDALTDHLKNRKIQPRVFTLPGTSFELEDSIRAIYGNKTEFAGVERDPAVFARAARLARGMGLKFSLTQETDLEFWQRSCAEPFDLIWLDYCGSWCRDKVESIRAIFSQRRLRFRKDSNPILGLTILAQRDHGLADLIETVRPVVQASGQRLNFLARIGGIPMVINKMANDYGMSARPLSILRYRDRTRSERPSRMLMFLFEILKGRQEFDVWSVPTTNMLQDYASLSDQQI